MSSGILFLFPFISKCKDLELTLNLFIYCSRFNMDSSETFLPNLLHYCYSTPIDALSPRRLALLLMHLSIGSLVDLSRPLGSLHGEAYHHLARAAVCEIPLMEEPDFDVLHALVSFLFLFFSQIKGFLNMVNFLKVLYDLVSFDILRQQESCWLCLESHGLCRQTRTRSESFRCLFIYLGNFFV